MSQIATRFSPRILSRLYRAWLMVPRMPRFNFSWGDLLSAAVRLVKNPQPPTSEPATADCRRKSRREGRRVIAHSWGGTIESERSAGKPDRNIHARHEQMAGAD